MALVLLVILPFVAGLAAWAAERAHPDAPRWVALVGLVGEAVVLASVMGGAGGTWLATLDLPWIPQFGIGLRLGLDGLSLLLVALTCVVGVVAVWASWREETSSTGFMHFNIMWTVSGVVGVFLALDLFLFFFFWEMMLLPAFLLFTWGGPRRSYAAVRFFLFTQLSGLLMLLGLLGTAFARAQMGAGLSFAWADLGAVGTTLDGTPALLFMLGFFIAFAVKLGVVPFHTWLPDAYVEAPMAGAILLAGIMTKTGAYGLLRFVVPLFPAQAREFAWVGMALGVAGILYGAALAFSQTDLKRLVAYSSISHMGFVLLGIFSFDVLAWNGAVMQMVAHGVSTSALFVLIAYLEKRTGTRDLTALGGLWPTVPRLSALLLVFVLATLGLPGLGNFVGEVLVLAGAFRAAPWAAALGAVGVVLATIYALRMIQRVAHGPAPKSWSLPDLNAREVTLVGLLVVAILWLGLFPQPVIGAASQGLASAQKYASIVTPGRPPVNAVELYALLPLVLPALGALAVLLGIGVRRSLSLSLAITLVALAASFGAVLVAPGGATPGMGALVTVDGFGRFYIGVLTLAVAALAVFGYGYLKGREAQPEEYFVLLLLATLGAGTLVISTHFVSFFVALEVLSVSLFGLIAYPRDQRGAIEAGVKYLVLAAVSASFLLFGLALIYSQTGTLVFADLSKVTQPSPVLLAGAALMAVGVGFKLGVVPFHMWAPDIFQGAPAPTAALVATISKGAAAGLLLRFLHLAGPSVSRPVIIVLAVVALLSMLGGNLLALYQRDVRRILAYSSISHLGFILIAFLFRGGLAPSAATFYVTAYIVTNLVVFGALILLAASGSGWTEVRVYRGLFWRRPWVASALAVGLMSLAGIPLTGGFVAKFYVGAAGVAGALWVWVLTLVLGSTIGLFYYLRWAGTMFLERPEEPVQTARRPPLFVAGAAVVAVLALVLVFLGVYPAPLIGAIQAAVATLP